MTAYWLGRTTIFDPTNMPEYHRLNALAEKRLPRRTLVRGGRFEVVEGTSSFDRFVIHEYPSIEAALEFYNSPEYQEAAAIRLKASNGQSNLVIVEGV